jgi:hypothetical protein
MLWYLLPKRLFRYAGYLQIWEFSFLISLLCIVTTRVLFRLLITRFFMNKLSTLRSIVILLVIISSRHHYFTFCFFFLVDCKFLYQVVFYFSFLFSSWQTLDAYSCRIVSLRGDVTKYRVIASTSFIFIFLFIFFFRLLNTYLPWFNTSKVVCSFSWMKDIYNTVVTILQDKKKEPFSFFFVKKRGRWNIFLMWKRKIISMSTNEINPSKLSVLPSQIQLLPLFNASVKEICLYFCSYHASWIKGEK